MATPAVIFIWKSNVGQDSNGANNIWTKNAQNPMIFRHRQLPPENCEGRQFLVENHLAEGKKELGCRQRQSKSPVFPWDDCIHTIATRG
jgi:hypothetical protein